jgi:HSP20 family protein
MHINKLEVAMTDNKEMVEVKNKLSWDEALEKEPWVAPLVDIYETADNYFLTANMPGVSKEDIKIKLEDGHLVLMGRTNYEEATNRKYVLKELEAGNFYRRFKISDGIDESKIDAKLENGILNVVLPKHERLKPKTIEIK